MSEFLKNILNVYTTNSLVNFTVLLLLTNLVTAFFLYLRSKSKKLLTINLASQLITVVLYLLFTYVATNLIATITNGYNQIGLFIVIMLCNLNIAIYASHYIENKKSKNPDPDIVNRAHFSSTLDFAVIMIILGLAVGLFSSYEMGQVTIAVTLTVLIMLFFTHYALQKTFVDKRTNKI